MILGSVTYTYKKIRSISALTQILRTITEKDEQAKKMFAVGIPNQQLLSL